MADCDILVNGLNLSEAPWSVQLEGTSVPPPPLKRQIAGSLLRDGEEITAASLGNREVVLRVFLNTSSEANPRTAAQAAIADLNEALDDERFDIDWGPGGVTFNGWRAPHYEIESQDWGLGHHFFLLRIPADPLAEA